MGKFISLKISDKDCKGIYLLCDEDKIESVNGKCLITSSKQADSLIQDNFKLQLRTKIGNQTAKKIYTFRKKNKSFIQALKEVASQREDLRQKFLIDGTVKEIKNNIKNDEVKGITFLERAEEFLKDKEVSTRHSTMVNYKTALLLHSKELHERDFSSINLKDIQKIG